MLLIQCILSCCTRQRLVFAFSSSLHQQYFSLIFDIWKGFEEKYFKSYVFGLVQIFVRIFFVILFLWFIMLLVSDIDQLIVAITLSNTVIPFDTNITGFWYIIHFLFASWNVLFERFIDQFPSLIINAILKENKEIMRTWILYSKLSSVET